MFLGITFLGWIILLIAYAPVSAILMWIGSTRGFRSAAFVVTAVLTSLPYVAAIAEAAYVEHNFRAVCATVKTVEKRKVVVPGFFVAGVSSGYKHYKQGSLKGFQHGLRFIEWKDKEGRFWRTEGFGFYEPQLKDVQIEKPTARYHKHEVNQPVGQLSHLVGRHEVFILDTETGEKIAYKIVGLRRPAYVDHIWRQMFDDTPTLCEDKSVIWGATLLGVERNEDAK